MMCVNSFPPVPSCPNSKQHLKEEGERENRHMRNVGRGRKEGECAREAKKLDTVENKAAKLEIPEALTGI